MEEFLSFFILQNALGEEIAPNRRFHPRNADRMRLISLRIGFNQSFPDTYLRHMRRGQILRKFQI